MGTDPIATTVVMTAEELVVYAAGHDYSAPPGVLGVVDALALDPDRERVFSLAARALVSRGVSVTSSADEPSTAAVEAILATACSPLARALVISDDGGSLRSAAFSIGEDLSVIQSWNGLNLHALRGIRNDQVHGTVVAAARLDTLGETEAVVEVRISAGKEDYAGPKGRSAVEALVAAATADTELSGEAKASLLSTVLGEAPGTTVMINPGTGSSENAVMLAWFCASTSGAWLIETSPTSPSTDGGTVRFVRVGRTQVKERISQHLGTIGVGVQ